MSNEPVRITPTENGPLLVEGAVTVCNPDGSLIRDGEKVFLCRCGLSGRKPFCDGTHSKENWTA